MNCTAEYIVDILGRLFLVWYNAYQCSMLSLWIVKICLNFEILVENINASLIKSKLI